MGQAYTLVLPGLKLQYPTPHTHIYTYINAKGLQIALASMFDIFLLRVLQGGSGIVCCYASEEKSI